MLPQPESFGGARGPGANGMKSSAVGGGDSIRPIPAATVISTPARKHWSSTNVVLNQFLVPDLILSPPLKEDDNNDLTFEETWATSDHWFQSNNSAPTQHWGGLYTALKARFEGNKADGLASGEQMGVRPVSRRAQHRS